MPYRTFGMSNSCHSKPSEGIQVRSVRVSANLAATAWFYEKWWLTRGSDALFSPISGMQREQTIRFFSPTANVGHELTVTWDSLLQVVCSRLLGHRNGTCKILYI